MHPGPLVTDNGFWDTFRTVYPLLGLLYPDKLGEIVQGWLNAYKEGGWIPGWASPGYRESMVSEKGKVRHEGSVSAAGCNFSSFRFFS